ncbi:MAG: ABC transporter permease [Candidatus Acidiferrales bacterium]
MWLRNALRNWRRKQRAEAELDEELRGYVEMVADEKVKRGLTAREALREAKMEMGGIEQVKEHTREIRTGHFLETLWQDLRYGARTLRKSPGFTIIAVLTLALGIGANTAIFSMVDWLTLRTPPVSKPEQLTTLAAEDIDGGWDNGFSYPGFADIRNQSTAVFSDVAGAMIFQQDGLSADGNNAPIWTNYVTGNFFQVMGVKPALGNFIEPVPGKSVDDEPVLVLSYSFWKAHFGSDPRIIGKSVLINGHPVTIIGVAPNGFRGITSLLDTQGYLPLSMAAVTSDASKDFLTDRKSSAGLTIVARLKTGAALASAQPVLKVIARRLSAQYPSTDKWKSMMAFAFGPMSPVDSPDDSSVVGLISALFLILAGAVLILACLNVANLLLARASGRQREMAVRAAVGGARNRLVRQLLTESLLLALLGCVAGIALGLVASRYMSSINIHMNVPLILDFQFDWRVFAYAFGAALLTALVVGIAPALRATRGNLNNLLHESARTATESRQRSRSVLVVAQIAGSLMLLIVAGLFVRSLRSVEHANLGFDPSNVLNFAVDPHQAGYNEAQAQGFLKNLLPRARALPSVETASLAATVPMGGIHFGTDLKIDGYQPPSGQTAPHAGYNAVSPQYFATMRIPVLRGRGILDSDGQNSQYVAVINEAMADKYWHSENPIGRHFTSTSDPQHSVEVVGVVENSRVSHVTGPYEPYLYVPLAQRYNYRESVTLQLRANLPLAAMNREVESAIHSLAPAMPVLEIQTMSTALDTTNGLLLYQLGAALAASLGILGLALAVIGVYGVVSYGASQRTHEIGIRMALGAQPAQVLRMIFRQGIFIVSAGLVAGILAAAAIARLVGNFLSGVSPVDPLTYISASLLLAAIALLACYIPAKRAMKVDPMVALRYE